jgi:two-component system alkaline phosphatase synthesis response regulator PhoP
MSGSKVLVADDEAHILAIVSMKLRNAGFDVITAVDGEEAMELVVAERPDLLITDNQMPYLTGLELCRKLRQSGLAPNLPVIMLTARGHDLDRADLAAAGITDVLAKPFSPREVLQKVAQLLSQKESTVTELTQ